MDEHPSPNDRRRTFMIVCTGYLILVAVLLVLSIVFSVIRSDAMIGIVRTALVAMLFPALVLLPITLLIREWRVAALMALPVAGLIAVYAPLFVPRAQAMPVDDADAEHRVLTVLTLNLHQPQGANA